MGRMLEVEVLKCPRCGADLHLSPGQDLTSCQYCGAQLAVSEMLKPGALGTDVDRKRYALELERQELAEHGSELTRLNAEIAALEAGPLGMRGDNLMVITIILFMGVFFSMFLFPLFFFLNISPVFGVSHVMCAASGITALVVLVSLIVALRATYKKATAKRQEETLQSQEYQGKLQRRKELEDGIRAQQAEIDRGEAELLEMLKAAGPPA